MSEVKKSPGNSRLEKFLTDPTSVDFRLVITVGVVIIVVGLSLLRLTFVVRGAPRSQTPAHQRHQLPTGQTSTNEPGRPR